MLEVYLVLAGGFSVVACFFAVLTLFVLSWDVISGEKPPVSVKESIISTLIFLGILLAIWAWPLVVVILIIYGLLAIVGKAPGIKYKDQPNKT